MVQDEALINIRSKVLRANTFEPLESAAFYSIEYLISLVVVWCCWIHRTTMVVAAWKARLIMRFLLKTKALADIFSSPSWGDYMGWFSEKFIF